MSQRPHITLLRGGLNLVTTPLATPPGMVIDAKNYEPDEGGYRRVGGFERVDGQPRPHMQDYWIVSFDQGETQPTAGSVIRGESSSARARFIDLEVQVGSFAGNDALGFFVVSEPSGDFTYHEDLEILVSDGFRSDAFQSDAFQVVETLTLARATSEGEQGKAPTPALDLQYRSAAIAQARSFIKRVPGSGPVRGVWTFGGSTYAFRDNAAGDKGVMWKATPDGWREQDLGSILKFKDGEDQFEDGQTVTGGTSAATADIVRIINLSGTYSGDDAAGYLVLDEVSGTFQDDEAITSASGAAKADGAVIDNELAPGGRYDFTNVNFYGATSGLRMYAAYGEGRAFEFDGTVMAPIFTGLSDALDKPTFIAEFKNHLFLSFRGGSVLFSAIGEPLQFRTIEGAGEIGFGSEVTGLMEAAASSLIFFGRSKISYLIGSDADSFDLQPLTDTAGAVPWTQAMVGNPIYLDQGGVRRMTTTEAFGNWRMGTLTQLIDPLIAEKRRNRVRALAAVTIRRFDQYKLFWSDGTGLTIYLGRETPEILPFEVPFTVFSASSCECPFGNERTYVGTQDGWVYEINAGNSYDGEEVDAFVKLAFDNVRSPSVNKRFHKATLEVLGMLDTPLQIGADFDSNNPDKPALPDQDVAITPMGTAEIDLDGFGRNVSMTIASRTLDEDPHTLSATTINYTPRRMDR